MTKKQNVISLLTNFNSNNGIIEYLLLFSAFCDFLFSDESLDNSARMQLTHYLENFLRENNLSKSITMNDLDKIFNVANNENFEIENINFYKTIFLLIYEDFTSNSNELSELLRNQLLKISSCLINEFCNNQITENNFIPEIENQITENNFIPETENQITENNFIPEIVSPKLINYIDNNLHTPLNFNNKNFTISTNNLSYIKEYCLRKDLLQYECSVCGLSEWQNEPLNLKIDKIRNCEEFDIKNYRFLCPNCYSQIGNFNENYF